MLLAAFVGLGPARARATGFTEIGQDIERRDKDKWGADIAGYLRMRTEALGNFDLDRGLTPSGEPLFPVSASEPTRQTLTHGDMRLRTDLKFYAPGNMVAVKARLDALDNIALGSAPEGIPSATVSQRATGDLLRLRRAWGEVLLPFGLLAAGRMGNSWGLGMLANGGDCLDCDSGDSADRIAFLTPVLGHIFAAAYDFSATGPQVARRAQGRTIGTEPSTDVRSFTFAALRYHDEGARTRRNNAGKLTVDYGAYVAHRWQASDVPVSYLPVAQPAALTATDVMVRGYKATALDAWTRVTSRSLRVEAELAYLTATVDQPSLLPGVLYRKPATSTQLGAALESDIGRAEGPVGAGLDMGYASGDAAPGFGAVIRPGAAAPKPGDLDGAQANPPFDNRADNFRFHPDYRVDRILFREIIGTVTDAAYVRPHVRFTPVRFSSGELTLSLAAVASTAVRASSTPNGKAPLGVELDPTLLYTSRNGFLAALEHAVLFPLAGLDNDARGLSAKPAQLLRLRLQFVF
jgi:uncharacterized protein (TIGR04551 family)